MKWVNAILNLLPFNGQKLKLSGLFLLIANLQHIIPGLDLQTILAAILANPTKAGLIAALVAAVHKIVKAQLPVPE